MTHKYEKDDLIGILYSPNYGAGWSSWADHDEKEQLLFDPEIIEVVLEHQESKNKDEMMEKINAIVVIKGYQSYMGGARDLAVEMVPKGTLFRIHEYDGFESIELKESDDWILA